MNIDEQIKNLENEIEKLKEQVEMSYGYDRDSKFQYTLLVNKLKKLKGEIKNGKLISL